MDNDVYFNPTKVFFGKDTELLVGEEVAKRSQKVLLHYGSGSAERSGLLDRIRKSLKDAGVAVFELGGVQPNPRLELVYEGINICRHNGIGFVLAVGGGSVIDSAKAIACGTPNSDDVWDYFVGKKKANGILPLATVLTIPGAGSQSSNGMVITKEETMEKMAYEDERSRPVFSVLNPELTYTVPPYHTAAGIVDAFAHIMERYFTNTADVDVTDRMCEGVMKSLLRYGRTAVTDAQNYRARAETMWACKMAHDGTLGLGREEDWASHMIEHELSAKFDVSHGAGLSVIFPAWMKYVSSNKPERFVQFAMRVFDVEYSFDNQDWTIKEGIKRMMTFFKSLNMPTSLRDLGINDKDALGEMAKRCVEHCGGTVGNFVQLNEADVRNILEIAY
ncbi:MAG: iron-containing alcohol dehydrogenase [Christensenella sp.]|uniref:iron-containing alcohol dehydrogenase n=1 Tax=Christensenella sp. TaxID=1935934 RepID=UPI002B1FF098|nr:iron-containing alcohol dehydrogenase [Christensenella sp.]MEA5003326.1 iron-containing alcohol dehydrogenase [Christensenella sp.]